MWLYHYTGQDGLIGMLRDSELWATQVQYMNDSMEFEWAVKIALESVAERMGAATSKELAYLGALQARLVDKAFRPILCAASLTEAGDLLSQWRGYCTPGNAFSLGLRRDHLRGLVRAAGWQLERCLYDENAQKTLIDTIVSAASKLRNPEEGAEAAMERLVSIAPFCKHLEFAEEVEWRLVSPILTDGDTLLRRGKHSLIPYVPFSFADQQGSIGAEVRVIVGPTQVAELSRRAVEQLLFRTVQRNSPRTDWEVDSCRVPYRDW